MLVTKGLIFRAKCLYKKSKIRNEVQNKEQEEKLTDWFHKLRKEAFKLRDIAEILFNKCQNCTKSGRREKGHHHDRCNIGT